jgi:hypothetical protein
MVGVGSLVDYKRNIIIAMMHLFIRDKANFEVEAPIRF